MNIEKHLILVKGEDKTAQIHYCKYIGGTWTVSYQNNSTNYSYKYLDVVWHREPKVINHETCVVYDDKPIYGIGKILDFGDYIKIIFKNGFTKTYSRLSIIIEETCLTNMSAYNCFEQTRAQTWGRFFCLGVCD